MNIVRIKNWKAINLITFHYPSKLFGYFARYFKDFRRASKNLPQQNEALGGSLFKLIV